MGKPSRRQRTTLFFVSLLVYATVIGLLVRDRYIDFTNSSDTATTTIRLTPPVKSEPPVEASKTKVPSRFLIDVPFTVQAPFGVWDALHQETCEEASLMMVRYFRAKESFGTLQEIDDELKALVAWQTGHNYDYDVTLAELLKIARDYYSMTSGRIIADPSLNDVKRELAEGRPVILPAAGRLLENPNFTAGGPPYHMLVIRGYDENGFITNDPGTRRGEGFRYSFENLMDSMHDWTGNKATITSGRKAVLVFD